MSFKLEARNEGLGRGQKVRSKTRHAALTPVVPGALLMVVEGACVVVPLVLPSSIGNACTADEIKDMHKAKRARVLLENAMMMLLHKGRKGKTTACG